MNNAAIFVAEIVKAFDAVENYFHKYLSEYNTRADRVK
jgi:hypothetical protein